MVARRLSRDPKFLAAQYTTCDYMLGGNPLNMTWMTGLGARSPREVFHPDSLHDKIPGPVAGIPPLGPYRYRRDHAGPRPLRPREGERPVGSRLRTAGGLLPRSEGLAAARAMVREPAVPTHERVHRRQHGGRRRRLRLPVRGPPMIAIIAMIAAKEAAAS
jgi:hypothetical protein